MTSLPPARGGWAPHERRPQPARDLMQVNLRGGHRGMSEQVSGHVDVAPGVSSVAPEGMPQCDAQAGKYPRARRQPQCRPDRRQLPGCKRIVDPVTALTNRELPWQVLHGRRVSCPAAASATCLSGRDRRRGQRPRRLPGTRLARGRTHPILLGKGGVAGGAAPPGLPALPCLVLRQGLEISGSAGVVRFAGCGLAVAPPA